MSFIVEFDDVCPICNYGIDMQKEAYHNFHDISQDDQERCKVACVHICPHCHSLFFTEHKMIVMEREVDIT